MRAIHKPDLAELRQRAPRWKPWERLAPGFAFSALGVALTRIDSPVAFGWNTVAAGWAITCGGTAALVIGLIMIARQQTTNWRSRLASYVRAHFDRTYDRLNCTTDDVRVACAMGSETVGDVCPTYANVLPRFEKNPNIIQCFRQVRGKKSRMCGYFIVYPLTKAADAAILSGMIRNGPMIKAEHVSKRFEQCTALYIAMIHGIDRSSRAFILFCLKELIVHVTSHNPKIQRVYGNPTTLDGARLLDQYGFVPVSAESPLLVAQIR